MKIAELKKSETEYHVTVSIPESDISESLTKELSKIAKTAKMDGFRAGKVPASILRKKYLSSIKADVLRDKISDSVKEVIEKNKLNVAGDPVVEDLINKEGKDLEFSLKFELLPKITLPDFKKISIEKAKLQVDEKDIQDQIARLASFSKSYEEESKVKSKKGDQVTIDAVGYVDGKAFDGGKLDSHKLVLGSGAFIPGFEDQLVGYKAGDDVTVKVEFPKDYHEKSLAGKPSEFKVNIKAIHKETPISIDDEFAKKFKCDSLDKLREEVSANIENSYENAIHTLTKMRLFDKLDGILKFNAPKSLLAREVESLKKQTNDSHGHDHENCDNPDHDHSKDKKTKDSISIDNLASRRVKIGLMLAEYIKQNSIKIEESDIRQAVIDQARQYPGHEQQVFEFYQKNPNLIESLKGPILEEKAVKEIFAKEISFTEKSYSKSNLEKLLDKEIRD